MPVQMELIKTEVDLLINLLKNVKEISMEDAARELGVPRATIESWVNFLEEEGVISLKYKFTTPYLVYQEGPKEKEKEKPEFPVKLFEERSVIDETQKEIHELDNLLTKAYAQTKAGEFGLAKQSYPVVVDRFKNLRERIFSLLKGTPHIKDVLKKEIDEIEKLLGSARKHTEEKKFDLANSLYSQIYTRLKSLLIYVKTSCEAIPIPQKPEKVEILPKRELKVSDIQVLLDAAYRYMKEEKFEEAKAIYERLSELYYALPREFTQRKTSIEQDLVKLNKDLSLKMDRFAKNQISEGSHKIKSLLLTADPYTKKNDFDNAAAAYYKIKELYESLPAGFPKEKKELETGIIKLYEAISAGREKLFTEEMSEKSGQIIILLNKLRDKIKNNDIPEAGNLYEKVKRIYEGLPPGFLREKVELQDRIISVYELISSKYREIYYKVLQQKGYKIIELIRALRQKLKNNDIVPAEGVYKEIKQTYMELPEGFLKEKTELQNKILKAYEEFSEKSEAIASRDFTIKLSEINKLLEDAENLTKKKEYDLADELYPEITKAFSLLPQGFIEKKVELRNRILNLYREIMLNIDSPFLRWYGEDVNEKYKEILKQIIRARRAIEGEDFDLLEVIYGQIRRMFEELPLGFVQHKIKLREDALRLYREIQLYKLLPEIEELAKRGDFQSLRKLLEFAAVEKQKLMAENSEESKLFSFLERKFSNYRSLLGGEERKQLLKPSPIKPYEKQEEQKITISTASIREPRQIPRLPVFSTEKDYSELKEKVWALKRIVAPKVKEMV